MDGKGKGAKGTAKGIAKGAQSSPSKGGDKGKGKGSKGRGSTTKNEIKPTKAMKPLWWRRLLLGSDIKEDSIWEKLEDETKWLERLPIEEFETRFSKAPPAKPSPQPEAETGTSPLIRIST